jgi:hypothetical protein
MESVAQIWNRASAPWTAGRACGTILASYDGLGGVAMRMLGKIGLLLFVIVTLLLGALIVRSNDGRRAAGESALAARGLQPSPGAPTEAVPVSRAVPAGRAVRIEHQLVIPAQNVVEPAARSAASPQVRRASRPAREAQSPVLMSRARRVLFGDGRYKPEPFPRTGQ